MPRRPDGQSALPLQRALVRPADDDDAPGLLRLAEKAGVGFTTLPSNPQALARRIAQSQAALRENVEAPGSQSYFFVLECDGEIVGCSGLVAAVGLDQAFYNYHVGRSVFASRELKVYREVPTLYLGNDLTGCSELGTLFVDPAWRQSGAGQLIGLSRFLFIAAHRQRFSQRIIAELRGVADDAGRSPFWESLGRRFFAMDFSQADRLSAADTRSFIAELMPQHPVYTSLLSDEAREVIGEVHADARGARRLLEAEGFRFRDYIDIFDAGPALEAQIDDVRSVRDAVAARAKPVRSLRDSQEALVANPATVGFRCIRCPVAQNNSEVQLLERDVSRLAVQAGDSVWVRYLGDRHSISKSP